MSALSNRPLFKLGTVVVTPGAIDLLAKNGGNDKMIELLQRHIHGDWGDLSEEDKKENTFAVGKRLRILSAYHVGEEKIWIITEADRSATTLLLPEDY